MRKKVTIPELYEKKKKGEKIVMITSYDYPMTQIVNEADIDIILVGDSLGMVVQGLESTVPVTMDEIVYHCRCVMRANKHAFVVGDMPFLSYEVSIEEAVRNAGRIMKEGGVDAVKLEGGVRMADRVEAIVRAGIPVMGHIGLTPQSVSLLGGFKVQGKSIDSARNIIEDAIALEQAGVFSIILECVPSGLAEIITRKVSVPTIGIGAGPHCDGQVLVLHDMLGLFKRFKPRFVKTYIELYDIILKALEEYRDEVKSGGFPTSEHSFTMNEEVYNQLKEEYLKSC
ncbi:MAG: 3-methyl-2-oxobutanoate hydroxymethyltransferase [Synergistetes bacterium]|nr:3-methyl-2-oxobutanoate hydroxymethyltransferase [Synergistota bacterium]